MTDSTRLPRPGNKLHGTGQDDDRLRERHDHFSEEVLSFITPMLEHVHG